MRLRPYQQTAVEVVYSYLRGHDDNPVVVLPTGCHVAGHPILMFDGSVRPVEDVRVGDLIMGPDSRPRRVLNLCRGEDDLFEITPNRGEPFRVNGDHRLSLVCTNEGKLGACYRTGGEIEHVTVRDYLTRSPSWRHLRKLYRTAVDFAEPQDLPIPPYILGLLIGDGCLRQVVELTTADEKLANAWQRYSDSIGAQSVVKAYGGRCPTYRLKRGRGKFNVVTEALHALDLADCHSGNKFIPQPYLVSSRTDRLQLLAGLIDTDGSRHRSGFELITKSLELAGDIVFLARSLGFSANCRHKCSWCQTGAGGWFFRIHINGDCWEIPTRLPRKQVPQRRQRKSVLRTGLRIQPCGRGQYFGFVLDQDHLYVDGHFVVHHNSGKTPVIATFCKDAVERWSGRVLILAHVKELLEQAAEKLRAICPDVRFGIYSAGLKRRDMRHPVIVAGIQSVYKRACEFDPFDLVIVDEAHLIPPSGEGMYRQFLSDAKTVNPNLRVIGLTATPYRMTTGMICAPDHFLNAVCYEVGVRELIVGGYLCPLVTKSGSPKVDTETLKVRGGEFVAGEVEDLMDTDELVEAACAEIVELTRDRKSVLLFASGVEHGRHVQRVLEETHGVECGFVCGETSPGERDELLSRFRGDTSDCLFERQPLKYLCNVNVLTTGFDAPNIDCVAMLRPTASPGLYYQMVGRGFRLHPGKQNCLVLDYGGNVLRHGPVDAIQINERPAQRNGEAPAKECPECNSLIAAGYAVCPDCGYAFPPPERSSHDAKASKAGVLSGQVTDEEYEVRDITYSVHHKRNAPDDAPRTMRVEYRLGLDYWVSEWVCFEHTGYARRKAEQWWKQRSADPIPDSAEEAVAIAEAGGVAIADRVVVRSVAGEKFERIVAYTLGEIPEPVPAEAYLPDLDDLPF
jgi:DNA repair protein RadD